MPNQRICKSINSRGLKCRSWALVGESDCWKHSNSPRATKIRARITCRTLHSLKLSEKPIKPFTLLGKIILIEDMIKKVSGDKKVSKLLKNIEIIKLNTKIDEYVSQLNPKDMKEREKMTVSLQSLRELYPPLDSTA